MYAQVVLGLPVNGPFDYRVPPSFAQKIATGARVRVNFRDNKAVAYVVGLARKTNISKTKSILDLIDERGILDKNMLSLTRELSGYYCASWGQAIEAALPQALRKGKVIPLEQGAPIGKKSRSRGEVILLRAPNPRKRWDFYIREIRETLKNNRDAIILFPDKNSLSAAEAMLKSGISEDFKILCKYGTFEPEDWAGIKNGAVKICAGMRSAVFAPFGNLGLIIIDAEESETYKQAQVPHYHARQAAFMRMKMEGAKVILGASLSSLESFYLVSKGKARYIEEKEEASPEIKIIDMKGSMGFRGKRPALLSKYTEDSIAACLNSSGKALLFLNRSGFATHAACSICGDVLKCPRCNISLVYHLKEVVLRCHHCNFKMPPPKICPACNSGYIKYSGIGTERIENELSRMFPAARIKRMDKDNRVGSDEADIFISTASIIRQASFNLSPVRFDLIGVLFIDNSLNRIDFRAAEKTMALLVNLKNLAQKRLIIQTRVPGHHCFRALQQNDAGIFYEEELRQRRQLKFPPYSHVCLVKTRGESEVKARETAENLFKELGRHAGEAGVEVVSLSAAVPPKLRDNFYWQIFLKSPNAGQLSKFLKNQLRKIRHSGTIITVDMDPL